MSRLLPTLPPQDGDVVRALLEHIERPVALADPAGTLISCNNLFLQEAEQLGIDPEGLSFGSSGLMDRQGLPLHLPLIHSELVTSPLPAEGWQLLELPGRVVSLPTLSRVFENLAANGAALLQIELCDSGNLLRRLGMEPFEAILDALERRLLTTLPQRSTLCRCRHERLLALVPGDWSREGLRDQAERWHRQWSAPLQLGGQHLDLRLSLGLSRSPHDGERFDDLLSAADQALQHAHRQGGGSVCLSSPASEDQPDQHHLASPLALAIDEQRLDLLYQPIVDLRSGRLQGVEVLSRWHDPDLGLIAPCEFIAVAEATAQINPLGEWLIARAFEQIRRWRDRQLCLDYVSINISPLQLQSDGLVDTLHRNLRRHGLSASGIMLEMTENRAFETSAAVRRRLWSLHELGFTLAMDDYGTGYSSMQRLTSLPFRALKVDRCLIEAIEHDPLQQAVLRGVVELQDSMGLGVVVEGVERPGQRRRLLELGCCSGQGFLFSRPIPAAGVESLLRSQVPLLPRAL